MSADEKNPSPSPTGRPISLFCVAGEPSGDIHAGHLLRALFRALPGSTARGFGGHHMRDAGFEVLKDLPSEAIMGLFPVIAALPKIKGWFRTAEAALDQDPPDALLLVDYPGFNLRLAARAHARRIPVIWFISPQVWAWNRRRIKKIAEVVDLMLVILPFEVEVFRATGMETHYVGHPLVDHIAAVRARRQGLPEELRNLKHPVIGLFPGSRSHVVAALWPIFRRTIEELSARPITARATFVVAAADGKLRQLIEKTPLPQAIDLRITTGLAHEVMEAADVCLTTSGTTTLEIALHGKPMVLAYCVSRALWTIGKMVVRVPHIGLVNLIAGRGIVPEHIGPNLSAQRIADDLERLLGDTSERRTMLAGIDEVKRRLDTPGAYARGAEIIRSWWSSRHPPRA